MPLQNLEDYLKSQSRVFPLEDYLRSYKPVTLEDYLSGNEDYKKRKQLEKIQQPKEYHPNEGAEGVFGQFFRGAVENAIPFGLSKYLIGEHEPDTTAERVARGIGGFAGFLVPAGTIGKVVSKGAKALNLARLGGKSVQAARTIRLLEHLGKGALTLGAASAITGPMEDPNVVLQRAAEGAKIGAIFGAAGLAHWTKHKGLSWFLRQFGGRAAMLVTGEYQPGMLEPENLAQTVWHEAVNTFFLSHGIPLEAVLSGKMPIDVKQKVDFVDNLGMDFNASTEALSKISIPKAEFWKPIKAKLPVSEILPAEGDVPTKIDIDHHYGKVTKGVFASKDYPLILKWDSTKKSYVAKEGSAAFLEAMRLAKRDADMNRVEFNDKINVRIVKPKPPQKLKLDRVAQIAMMFKKNIVDAGLFVKFESTNYGAWDTKANNWRMIPSESYTSWRDIKLQPNEILFHKTGYSELTKKDDWMPVAKGSRVPSFKMKMKQKAPSGDVQEVEKRIFTLNNFEKWINQTEEAIDIYERRINEATRAGQPVLAGWTNQVDSLSLSLESLKTRRAMAADKIDSILIKKGIKIPDIEKMKKRVDTQVDVLLKSFYRPVPLAIRTKVIEDRLERSGSPFNLTTILRLLKVEDDVLRYNHLYDVERAMIKMEEVPPAQKPKALMTLFDERHPGLKSNIVLDQQQLAEQKITDDFFDKRSERRWKEAIYDSKHVQGAGSPIRQLLSLSRIMLWANVEKMSDYLENLTGIPFFKLTTVLARQRAAKVKLLESLEDPLKVFHQAPAEDQAIIAEYIDRLYRGLGTQDIHLTQQQQDYMETVFNFLEQLKPFVRKYRVMQWIEQVATKRPDTTIKVGDMEIAISAPSRSKSGIPATWKEPIIFKNQKVLEPILNEAYRIWKYEGQQKFEEFLEKHDNLGVISDAYLPEFILKNPQVRMEHIDEAARLEVNTLGDKHLQSRYDTELNKHMTDAMVDMFRESHLNNRLHAYANQVLNLHFLERPLNVLEDIINIFKEDMERAKPKGLGRTTPEAKGISLLEYYQVYAHRLKGYPIKTGPIGEILKATQQTFFRSLVVRPYLWLRNLPQRWVTVPQKSLVMDINYWFNRKHKFDSMPDEIKMRFETAGVNQITSFDNHYLMLKTSEKVQKIPVINTIWNIAEKFGHFYALSDMYNRRYVFSKVFFKTRDLVNDYYAGKLNAKQLDMKLGILKMERGAQTMIREAISNKNADDVAFEVGKWMADNSQWQYERSTKSVAEMTGEGESWTNLITWAKGMAQQNIEAGMNLKNGFEMWTKGKSPAERNRGMKMVYNSGSQIVGLILAGAVANTALSTISISHKKKFSDYGVDSMAWELGGVTTDILKGFGDAVSQVLQNFDGTKEDRTTAMNTLLKFFDNTVIRQLTPFMKNTLAGIESITGRSYIAPLAERVGKLMYGYTPQKTYVQRTLIEGVTHFIMASDPNKQEDVRKWVNRKTYELKWKAQEQGPMQPWFQARYEYYKYLNDLFMRYKPMEVFRDKLQREYLKHYQSIRSMEALGSGSQYQADVKKYELQRAGQLYGK